LVLGITFKENCPDIRNTKIVDIVSGLEARGFTVDIADPWALSVEVENEYGISLIAGRENKGGGRVAALSADDFYNRISNAKGIKQ